MATFKPTVQKIREDGTFLVYIRCTHNRKIGYIKTDKYVSAKNVSNKGEILDTDILGICLTKITEWNKKLNIENVATWTVQEVIQFLQQGTTDIKFIPFCLLFIERLRKEKRSISADNYEIALKSFTTHFGQDVSFQDITSKEINRWIDTLKHTARAKQMYPSQIKTMFEAGSLEYNDYDRNIIRIQNQPFRAVKIPKADTPAKRSIERELIKMILSVHPKTKRAELAQDVARLMIHLVGINTVDLFSIRKTDTHRKIEYQSYDGEYLRYKRSKTTRRKDEAYIEIKVSDEIKHIFDKYASEGEFLFDWKYGNLRDFNKYVNIGLKRLCTYLSIPPVDTYTFRHSWATIAQNKCGASTELVAFCLNHSSAHKVTEGYIEKDFTPIDKMNKKVIDYIFQRGEYERKKGG